MERAEKTNREQATQCDRFAGSLDNKGRGRTKTEGLKTTQKGVVGSGLRSQTKLFLVIPSSMRAEPERIGPPEVLSRSLFGRERSKRGLRLPAQCHWLSGRFLVSPFLLDLPIHDNTPEQSTLQLSRNARLRFARTRPLSFLLRSSMPTATPASYLRHAFTIPRKAFVGLLACQRDPLLSSLTTEVTRCDKRPPAPVVKGKKGKGAAVNEVPDEWEVELLDTGASCLSWRRKDEGGRR